MAEKLQIVEVNKNCTKACLPSKNRAAWPRAGALSRRRPCSDALDDSSTSRCGLCGQQTLYCDSFLFAFMRCEMRTCRDFLHDRRHWVWNRHLHNLLVDDFPTPECELLPERFRDEDFASARCTFRVSLQQASI